MNVHDILDSRSNEILDLFHTIDKIQQVIDMRADIESPSLTDDPLLDNREVCKLLQLSPRTLQDYRDKRLIAFYKLEVKILYRMSDILCLLEKNYYDVWKQRR